MNSVWLSLLWKEWCEFRWKLVALTASFVIGQGILMSVFMGEPFRDQASGLVVSMVFCLVVYAALAGAFVGMGVAASENSNRTMRFTHALPIPMWKAATVRILLGFITVVLPILVVVAIVWWYAANVWQDESTFNQAVFEQIGHAPNLWQIPNFFLSRAVAAIVGVISLLIWFAACGVNRSDEVRAGAISFLICAVLWGMWFYCMEENVLYLRHALEMFTVGLPGGPAFGGNLRYGGYTANVPLLATIALVVHGSILAFFVMRYGKSTGRVHTGGKQFITDWFRFHGPARPFRSQSMAIIWKQVRELGPLALMAVGGILAFMAFAYISEDKTRWQSHDWSNLLGGLTMTVAAFITLVSGIGVIYEDYSRGLPNFWRSRPINLHQWFALKYFTGILILVIAFVPLLLIAGKIRGWNMDTKSDVAMFVLIYLMLYSGSLAAYALVRQLIYAVVLTIAGIWFTPGILLVISRIPGWNRNEEQTMRILIAIQIVIATILAWQAVVRDWGWKRHR